MLPTILGVLGIIFNMIIYQQKNRKKLLLLKLVSDVLWALHYYSINALSAAAIAVISIFRESVFLNDHKKWAKSKLWLILFLIASIISAILTKKNIFSLLPATASLLSVLSFWQNRPKLSRYLAIPISICMLTYDIVSHSHTGVVNELLTLFSVFLGMFRYDFGKTLERKRVPEQNNPPKYKA